MPTFASFLQQLLFYIYKIHILYTILLKSRPNYRFMCVFFCRYMYLYEHVETFKKIKIKEKKPTLEHMFHVHYHFQWYFFIIIKNSEMTKGI